MVDPAATAVEALTGVAPAVEPLGAVVAAGFPSTAFDTAAVEAAAVAATYEEMVPATAVLERPTMASVARLLRPTAIVYAEAQRALNKTFPVNSAAEAREIGERLAQTIIYLMSALVNPRSGPVPMSAVRFLTQSIAKVEQAEFSRSVRSVFEERFLTSSPELDFFPVTDGTSLQNRAVNAAKVLVLLSVLRYEDRNFFENWRREHQNNLTPQALFQTLTDRLAALEKVSHSAKPSEVIALERPIHAIEALIPWARALFPEIFGRFEVGSIEVIERRITAARNKLKDGPN